jgi:hypothetical protein
VKGQNRPCKYRGGMWGREGISPCILILGNRWIWLVINYASSFTSKGTSLWVPWKKMFGRSHRRSERFKKISTFPGTKLRFLLHLGTCSPLKYKAKCLFFRIWFFLYMRYAANYVRCNRPNSKRYVANYVRCIWTNSKREGKGKLLCAWFISLLNLWRRKTHALRHSVQGSTPEWFKIYVGQLWSFLYSPCWSFPFCFFLFVIFCIKN